MPLRRLLFSLSVFSTFLSWGQDQKMINADGHVRAVYDSLERVQRRVDIGVVPRNKNKEYTISIGTQKELNNLQEVLLQALKKGERNIRVRIKSGSFFFGEQHLKLINQRYPEADIIIEGNKTTFIPSGRKLKNSASISGEINGESSIINLNRRRSISPWGDLMYADTLVEVVNESAKLCRLKCMSLGGLKVPEGNMAYLNLTRWCRCFQYKVTKIENGYVYFRAHDLGRDSVFHQPYFNVNYDYVVAKVNPRFRLCYATGKENVSVVDGRVSIPRCQKSIYLCDVATFLTIQSSEFRQFSIKGICFLGGRQKETALLQLMNTRTKSIEIANCKFIGQMGRVLSINNTDNVWFHNNYVRDNYDNGVYSYPSSSNTTIEFCSFENNGTGLSSARCVTCMGRDYYIGHNSFKNFGYNAISVGEGYGAEMKNPARGIVEFNNLSYDKNYFKEPWKHTIMDGGAIYVWTQNAGSIIRYNYIHNFSGIEHNRGIYCDDGAHHVAVYGNVIVSIPNGHAISSRRVAGTESGKNKRSKSLRNNINNFIAFNITDGSILFVGHENKYNGCVKGMNIQLNPNGEKIVFLQKYKPEVKNVEVSAKDEEVDYKGFNNKGIRVRPSGLEVIESLPCYGKIKEYIR